MSNTLLEVTYELLDSMEGKESICTIAANAGLTFYWVRSFKSRMSKSPNVNNVQKLYEYLAGEPLQLVDPKQNRSK